MYSFLHTAYVKMEPLVWLVSIAEEDHISHYFFFFVGNLPFIVKIEEAEKLIASFILAILKFKYASKTGFIQDL